MCALLLNTLGLILDIGGVILLFFYANPQPLFDDGIGGIGLTDADIVPGTGKTVRLLRQEGLELRYRFRLWSRFALLLLGIGFVLQITAVWVARLQ